MLLNLLALPIATSTSPGVEPNMLRQGDYSSTTVSTRNMDIDCPTTTSMNVTDSSSTPVPLLMIVGELNT